MKDTSFYDKESSYYSIKRYVNKPISYTQYFFGRRLKLTLDLIRDILLKKDTATLLEIGCADGVVMKKIAEKFPGKFRSMIGIDISSGMIQVASRTVARPGVDFLERKNYQASQPKDIVLEIGVANYTDFREEMDFSSAQLASDGFYILSIAGEGSMWSWFMRRAKSDLGFHNFLRYADYEALIKEKFEIVRVLPAGLFLPVIWKVPVFARIVQPILESFFALFSPGIFHEKIYLLRKK